VKILLRVHISRSGAHKKKVPAPTRKVPDTKLQVGLITKHWCRCCISLKKEWRRKTKSCKFSHFFLQTKLS